MSLLTPLRNPCRRIPSHVIMTCRANLVPRAAVDVLARAVPVGRYLTRDIQTQCNMPMFLLAQGRVLFASFSVFFLRLFPPRLSVASAALAWRRQYCFASALGPFWLPTAASGQSPWTAVWRHVDGGKGRGEIVRQRWTHIVPTAPNYIRSVRPESSPCLSRLLSPYLKIGMRQVPLSSLPAALRRCPHQARRDLAVALLALQASPPQRPSLTASAPVHPDTGPRRTAERRGIGPPLAAPSLRLHSRPRDAIEPPAWCVRGPTSPSWPAP